MTYVIAQPCVDLKDKACIEECPVDCIYEGRRSLYIHPDECVDCGACEPVCPVEAIYYEDDVPEEWADYYNANVEFFNDLGSPGGAAKLGMIDKDHPLIVALPPQEHDERGDRPLPPRFPLGLARALQGASAHPDGIVDLGRHSGRPHAPIRPHGARRGRRCPGYPVTVGTTEVREAICEWFGRRRGVPGLAPSQAIPTIGSKELVAWLPTLLGLGPGDIVGIPRSPTRRMTSVPGSRRLERRRPVTHSPRAVDACDHAEAAVAQQSQQPQRPGPRRRAPGQGRRVGARARRRRRERRVLRGA